MTPASEPETLEERVARANTAIISPCGTYRYRLERDGPGEGQTTVIMVNPSTADAERDDATIRKLKGFGQRNLWGRIIVGNVFAYRATDIRELGRVADPRGPYNHTHLTDMMYAADRVVVAWGPLAKLPRKLRGGYAMVTTLAERLGVPLFCIGKPAKDGHPRHPLMLPYSSKILPWEPAL